MQKKSYKIINGITLYRIIASPLLIYFVFTKNQDWFKWLLVASFFTDFIDGYLARQFKVTSILGSKLDSIGDDLTILAAVAGLFMFKFQFIKDEVIIISVLLSLYFVQNILALIQYKKITNFHTYMAKVAAILQGIFLILIFFLSEPIYFLFYTASVITILDLLEEIILILMLPAWKANVKGIYWVTKKNKKRI